MAEIGTAKQSHYGVILKRTSDMSIFCLGASSNLALWPISDFDP